MRPKTWKDLFHREEKKHTGKSIVFSTYCTCTCKHYVDTYCSSSLTSSVSSLISDVEEEEDISDKDYISEVSIPRIGKQTSAHKVHVHVM